MGKEIENQEVKQEAKLPQVVIKAAAETAKKLTIEEIDAEIKALELEEKRLAVQLSRANLEDTQERLDDRKIRRENARQSSYTKGQTLKQLAFQDEKSQARCNHRKGGNGANGYVGGQGDDPQYAVMKHTYPNGDTWIRCMRCGKTWKPPLESDFTSNAAYLDAVENYKEAVNFPTRNITSSSVVFKFSDGGQYYREITKNANLR